MIRNSPFAIISQVLQGFTSPAKSGVSVLQNLVAQEASQGVILQAVLNRLCSLACKWQNAQVAGAESEGLSRRRPSFTI
jgi:hypothetical protein